MSFEKISNLNVSEEERVFVILYNFNNKEISMIKNICRMIGVRDIESLSKINADSTIKNIIGKEIDINCVNGVNQKSIVFSNVSPIKVSAFIDSLKKFKISRPLIAVVTESNINWSLNNLISHLLEEKSAIKSGKSSIH